MFVSPRLMYHKVQERFFTERFNKEIKLYKGKISYS